MKLKNRDYILLSNIIITGIMQISYFNVIGLISVILSILYLCILLFSRYKSKGLLFLFIVSITSGIIYYFLNPLFENSNISWASLFPIALLLLGIINAIKMPIIKRNSFFGVKTPLGLKNDEVWKKDNNVGSIVQYISLFPLYIIIIYFDNFSKLILVNLTILFFTFLTLGIVFYIEKKYHDEMNRQEKISLENQRKKETGG